MVPLDETGYAGGAGVTDANGWSFMRGMFNDNHGDRMDGYLDDVRISNTALLPNQLLNSIIPSLTLVVNTVNGNVALRNDAAAALPLDYYEVTSAGGALRFADGQWNSLNDQNTDSLGAGNGQSWDEAGGVSANILSEAFLLSQTSLNPGQSISLGAAFNTATFGSGIDGDLLFKFSPKGRRSRRRACSTSPPSAPRAITITMARWTPPTIPPARCLRHERHLAERLHSRHGHLGRLHGVGHELRRRRHGGGRECGRARTGGLGLLGALVSGIFRLPPHGVKRARANRGRA